MTRKSWRAGADCRRDGSIRGEETLVDGAGRWSKMPDCRVGDDVRRMAVHLDKTTQRRKNSDKRTALAEEEDQILKCLGAAVLMRWNTVPTKLQRELFNCASTIGDLQQTTPLKGQIARFLHNHKNDQPKSA